jgi:hypothetical protein
MKQNKIDNSFPAKRLVENAAAGAASILSIKPVAKYFTGARCVIKLNGEIAAFATSVSWNIQTSAEEIQTIDSYFAHELAPTRVSVTGTISGFRIPGNSPSFSGVERTPPKSDGSVLSLAAGILGIGGTKTAKLIQPDSLSFLDQKYVSIEVRDSQTDNIIFATSKAFVVQRNESVRSGSMAELSLNFRAIGFMDERIPVEPERVKTTPN